MSPIVRTTPHAARRLAAGLGLTAALLLPACGDDATSGGPGNDADATPDAPKHFLLVSIDTLRADRLGSYGYERDTSPRIDAFAEDSLLFAQCTSAATNTTPSHMSMFTGLLPPVHMQFNINLPGPGEEVERPELLPPTMPLLAERLKGEGFGTFAMTDGGYLTGELLFDRGFDFFDRKAETVDKKVDRALERLPKLDWDGQRQFVFFHTYEVHAPYVPPVEHDLFSDPDYDGPWRAKLDEMRSTQNRGGVVGAKGFLPKPKNATPADTRFVSDLYDGGIHFTDAELGRLLDWFAEQPFADDVAILVMSDHGDAFNEHGSFGHGEVFHTVTHVPFILQVPGGPTGVSQVPISGVDTTPTVLDVLGLETPRLTDGRSVLGIWDGGAAASDRPILSYRGNPDKGGGMSFRRGDFKLLRNIAVQPWQQYDLATDFDETTPLPNDSMEVVRALEQIDDLNGRQAMTRETLLEGVTGQGAELSAETLKALEALGYVQGEG